MRRASGNSKLTTGKFPDRSRLRQSGVVPKSIPNFHVATRIAIQASNARMESRASRQSSAFASVPTVYA